MLHTERGLPTLKVFFVAPPLQFYGLLCGCNAALMRSQNGVMRADARTSHHVDWCRTGVCYGT